MDSASIDILVHNLIWIGDQNGNKQCIVNSTHRSHYMDNGSQFIGFTVCTMPNEVENNKHRISYCHDDLVRVCESAKQDKRYKIMDF